MKKRERTLAGLLAAVLVLLVFPACGAETVPGRVTGTPVDSGEPAAVGTPEPTPVPTATPEPTATPSPGERIPPELAEYGAVEDAALGGYQYLIMENLHPYVFAPTGAGSAFSEDFTTPTELLARYGEDNRLVVAVNGGIFYDFGESEVYCFHRNEADGVVIAGGTVLKSTESIDHTQCDILVFDEDGNCGWADWYADADALAAGTGTYYDMHGAPLTGKRIISALTGFVPIVVDGKNIYDPEDEACHGYDNYVNHYARRAMRQVFGVREDGASVVLTNDRGWTLEQAAEAALALGCVFAYNLDGGASVEAAVGYDIGSGYRVDTLVRRAGESKRLPTFLVFSTSETPPNSATPLSLLALAGDAVFTPGVTLEEIAAALRVSEYFRNADGYVSERRLYSAQFRDPGTLTHTLLGGESRDTAVALRTDESPAGTLYYTKTEADTARSLARNGNTRSGGAYYDYSTGFTLETEDDLTLPGTKTLTVSYVPGGGMKPLTTTLQITLEEE